MALILMIDLDTVAYNFTIIFWWLFISSMAVFLMYIFLKELKKRKLK
jgi:hypothetical protein